ncbi:MAG: glycosyltransferase family 2 protein [Myxococcota bacterium]|nr:glycosyltransferase family 2 protein [Myxococcota bacterium]
MWVIARVAGSEMGQLVFAVSTTWYRGQMFGGKTIAVVIPAHNEEQLIAYAIRRVPSYVDVVIVVDDASDDDTKHAMHRAAPRPGLYFLTHAVNRGVGGAIVTGYKHALRLGAEVVAVMAGDAQMDPADLPQLLLPIVEESADYAKGDRLSHAHVASEMPLMRLIGNHALSLLTRYTSGYRDIRDSQCGYTAASAEILDALDLDALYEGYGFPNDMLAHLHAIDARVAQVTVRPIYGLEKSEISLVTAFFRVPRVLYHSRVNRIKKERKKPLQPEAHLLPIGLSNNRQHP